KDNGEIEGAGNAWPRAETGPDSYERGEQEQAAPRGGAISVLSPSPLEAKLIWAGTNNGLIQITQDDAATWHNVSPSQLTDKAVVWSIEPSHYDADTAYATFEIRRDET